MARAHIWHRNKAVVRCLPDGKFNLSCMNTPSDALSVGTVVIAICIYIAYNEFAKLDNVKLPLIAFVYKYRREIVIVNMMIVMIYQLSFKWLNMDYWRGYRVLIAYNAIVAFVAVLLRIIGGMLNKP